jgi:cell division protease FtsH
MSEDELRLVAYHEIGHALVGHLSPLCDPVERVTVIPQGQALGVTISLPTEDRMLATRGECVARLAMMMAGRAAEDLQRAAVLARRMVEQLGMAATTTSESLKTALPGATGSAAAERVEEAARILVEDGRRKAAELLEANAELLHRAAVRLIEVEALERDDLLELFGPRPEGRRIAPLAG